MTLIEIPNCSHDEFALIRNRILDNIPGALVNDIYVGPRLTAYFMFISEAWVPKALTPFIKPLSPIVKDIDFSDLPIAAINKRPVVLPTLHKGGFVQHGTSKQPITPPRKIDESKEVFYKGKIFLIKDLEVEGILPSDKLVEEGEKILTLEEAEESLKEAEEFELNMVVTIPDDTKLYTKEELKALQAEPLIKKTIGINAVMPSDPKAFAKELLNHPAVKPLIEAKIKELPEKEEETEDKPKFTAFDRD